MGRVAKYKKVKSFDPYSKNNKGKTIDLPTVGVWGLGDDGRRAKKRSRKAEQMHARKSKRKKNSKKNFVDDGGFDVPPMAEDDFDMADLVGSVKKQEVDRNSFASDGRISNKSVIDESYDKIITSSGNVANIPKTDEDENKVTRLLRLDKKEEQEAEKQKQLNHKQMEGESKRAYAKRTRAETRQIIKNSNTTKNEEKLQRKKEFLRNKKQKKRKGGAQYSYNTRNDDGESSNNTYYNGDSGGKGLVPTDTPVRFGEQVERPPIFRQIPRGAKPKSNTTKPDKDKSMSEDQIAAERSAMELMRRRVQAKYRAMRSNRRDGDDFHL